MNPPLKLILVFVVLLFIQSCKKDINDVSTSKSLSEMQAWYERQRMTNNDPQAFVNVNKPDWNKTQILQRGDSTLFITPVIASDFKRELHVTYYDGSYTGLVRQLDSDEPKEYQVISLSINGRPINRGYYDEDGNFVVTYNVTKNNIVRMGTESPGDGGGSGSDPGIPGGGSLPTVIFENILGTGIGATSEIEFEEDNFSLGEPSESFRFSPLKYSYNHRVERARTLGGEIIKVNIYDASVHPSNETVIHPTLGNATRNVTIFNQSKSSMQTSNTTARLTWSFSVNFRYSFSDPNRATITRQRTKTYSKNITF